VGQYQHDVDQNALKKSLDDVVISSVNAVGVEVNSASKQLLTYVAGLGPQLARNIIEYRNEEGPFRSRHALMKVPRLGQKAFEQAAGFLRVRGENPLDASAVHPESYVIVEAMARDLGCCVKELMSDEGLRKQIDLEKYITDARPGLANSPSEYLFLTRYGTPLNPLSFQGRLNKYRQEIGLKKSLCVYTFRHTCATHLLEGGADIRYIQQLLGHSCLSSTEIYTHIVIAVS